MGVRCAYMLFEVWFLEMICSGYLLIQKLAFWYLPKWDLQNSSQPIEQNWFHRSQGQKHINTRSNRKPPKKWRSQIPHSPMYCILFKIHCSKLKPYPVCNSSWASVKRIQHSVLLFSVCKYAFYCFFSLIAKRLWIRRQGWTPGPAYKMLDQYYPEMRVRIKISFN